MAITQNVQRLRSILGKVSAHPHPEVGKGTFYCNAIGGNGRAKDDSCVSISGGCYLDCTASITVGKWVMIGAGARLYTHEHMTQGRTALLFQEENLNPDEFTTLHPKIIEDDVWINSSIVLAKCNFIAQGVIIGAGSIVTCPITDQYTIWAGNPARRIGTR